MSPREEMTDVLASRPQQLSLFQGTQLSEGLPTTHHRGRIPPASSLKHQNSGSIERQETGPQRVEALSFRPKISEEQTSSDSVLAEDARLAGFRVRVRLRLGKVHHEKGEATQGRGQRLAERRLTHGHLTASLGRFQRA